jgi:UCH-binding domain
MDDFARAMAAAMGQAQQGQGQGGAAGSAGAGGGGTDASTAALLQMLMAGGGRRVRDATTPLPYILDSESMIRFVRENSSDVVPALLPHLPPGQQNMESLIEILRSPQLRQASMALSSALEATGRQSGTVGMQALFSNFGLRPSDGESELNRLGGADRVGAMLAAIQAKVDRERGSTGATVGAATAGAAGAGSSSAAAGETSSTSAATTTAASGARAEASAEGKKDEEDKKMDEA